MKLVRRILAALGASVALLAITPGVAHAAGGTWTWTRLHGFYVEMESLNPIRYDIPLPTQIKNATTYSCTASAQFRSENDGLATVGMEVYNPEMTLFHLEDVGPDWWTMNLGTWYKNTEDDNPVMYVYKSGFNPPLVRASVTEVVVRCEWSTIE